jgi:PAS domain S-box-containing protein
MEPVENSFSPVELFNQSGCIMIRLDSAGRITFVNEGGLRFYGAALKKFLGERFEGLFVDDADYSGINRAHLFENIFKNPKAYSPLSLTSLDAEQNRMQVLWQFSHHLSAIGEITGIIAIGMPTPARDDQSPQKSNASEKTAAISQEKTPFVLTDDDCRFVYEKEPALNFIVDVEGFVLYVNDFAVEIIGLTKDDIIGTSIFAMIPPEEHEKVSARLEEIGSGKQASGAFGINIENFVADTVKIITPGGLERTFLFSHAWPISDGGAGRPKAFFVSLFDVTELGALLKAHQMAESLYQRFFNASTANNSALRFDGTILAINEAVASKSHKTPAELVGKNMFEESKFVNEEYYKKIFREIENRCLAAPEKLTVKTPYPENILRFETKHGKFVLLFPSEYPVIHEDGKPIGFISSSVDISELEAVREELEAHRDHLQELVTERTRDLEATQVELVKKERLATLGHLTATVSHELRNPLGTVSTSLYVIDKRTRESGLGIEAALDRARRNLRRCDDIIEELLNYTREEAFKPVPTDVDGWIASFLDEQPAPDGIRLEWRPAAAVIAPLDTELFRRCMINLLSNAYQAVEMRGEEKRVFIETRRIGDRMEIRIADTGAGITPEHLPRIFEPLYSTKSFGVGLGLPIAQKIAGQHGGDLHIESDPGEGTTVTVSIPLTDGCGKEK